MSERTAHAYEIVGRYWKWSAAAGLINVPLLDVAAVTGVQLKMIAELAKVYTVPFSRDRAKAIIGALVGAMTPAFLSGTVMNVLGPSTFAVLPGLGAVVGVLATPTFNAASTYALGRVFVQHFESGGTFLDMDPDKVRGHYRQELAAAKS
jgi:uncharacterized protein (DUF697 family)